MASTRVGPEPAPGDLIEVFHETLFEHWAVYVGDGFVVHLTDVDIGVSGVYLLHSASGGSTRAVVKKQLLTEVTAGKKYRVNNKYDDRFQPLPPKEIVRNAERQVGQVKPYSLTLENCEHFATKMRYKVPLSDQVWEKLSRWLGVAGGILAFAAVALTRVLSSMPRGSFS